MYILTKQCNWWNTANTDFLPVERSGCAKNPPCSGIRVFHASCLTGVGRPMNVSLPSKTRGANSTVCVHQRSRTELANSAA
jgi:hypothetical protein